MQKINARGFKLLTSFESCKLDAYDDGGGVWTIGYGHTSGVVPGMKISQAQAEDFLREDLARFEKAVFGLVSVDLGEDQFSALVCFCFNVGSGAFLSSTLLKTLNTGNYAGAALQLLRWSKVDGKPWLGLTRRRLAEMALFLGQPWEFAITWEPHHE